MTAIETGTSRFDEINRISKKVDDHRLDYTEAIGMVIDIWPSYDHEKHAKWTARKFFREMCPNTFAWIQNAGVAVQAFNILKAEANVDS